MIPSSLAGPSDHLVGEGKERSFFDFEWFRGNKRWRNQLPLEPPAAGMYLEAINRLNESNRALLGGW